MLTCLLVCGSIYYKKKKKLLAPYMRQEVNVLIIELFGGSANRTFISNCYSSGSDLNILGGISFFTCFTGNNMIYSRIYCCFSRAEIFTTDITNFMPLADRLFHCLCYPVVIPGCRNTLRVAAAAGAGVRPYSRIAAGRLRGHSANIAVGMGRLAGRARRTGAAGAGLAGRTIV